MRGPPGSSGPRSGPSMRGPMGRGDYGEYCPASSIDLFVAFDFTHYTSPLIRSNVLWWLICMINLLQSAFLCCWFSNFFLVSIFTHYRQYFVYQSFARASFNNDFISCIVYKCKFSISDLLIECCDSILYYKFNFIVSFTCTNTNISIIKYQVCI